VYKRQVLKDVPLNRILTESDGNVKYTIDNVRVSGSPGIIPDVIHRIGKIKDIQIDELLNILQENIILYAKIEGD